MLLCGSGVGVENAVGPDQIGVKGPTRRVGFEVTQKDVDVKGRSKRILGNANIGDPFRVLVTGVFSISFRRA